MDSLTQFIQAYEKLENVQRASISIYCLCGREFPQGEIPRVLYGSVHYASNRCPVCEQAGAKC